MLSAGLADPHPGRRRARIVSTLFASTVLLGTMACSGGDSATGPGNVDATGIYGLVEFNNQKAPVVIYNGQYYDPTVNYTYDPFIIAVTGGEISLNEDGTFHLVLDLLFSAEGREATGGTVVDGEYEVRGGRVTLYDEKGKPLVGQLRNDVLSLPLGVRGKEGYAVFRHAP